MSSYPWLKLSGSEEISQALAEDGQRYRLGNVGLVVPAKIDPYNKTATSTRSFNHLYSLIITYNKAYGKGLGAFLWPTGSMPGILLFYK